jgi:hypothetical protein
MYTVYLGLQDKSTIGNANISPAVKMSVATVKRVNIKKLLFSFSKNIKPFF